MQVSVQIKNEICHCQWIRYQTKTRNVVIWWTTQHVIPMHMLIWFIHKVTNLLRNTRQQVICEVKWQLPVNWILLCIDFYNLSNLLTNRPFCILCIGRKLQSTTKVLGIPGSDSIKMGYEGIMKAIPNGITRIGNPLPPIQCCKWTMTTSSQ